jgi:hypothetical protein
MVQMFATGQVESSGWHVLGQIRYGEDGMGPRLKFQFHLRPSPPLGPPALDRIRRVASTTLRDAPIEDDLDAVVRRKPFTEISI